MISQNVMNVNIWKQADVFLGLFISVHLYNIPNSQLLTAVVYLKNKSQKAPSNLI